MTLLCPLPGCRFVRAVRDGPGALTVLAQARHDHARCQTCRTLSTSVHSRYHRRPTDLPVNGNAVRLQLTVRRFYCRDPACPRHTFAERFPYLLVRHAPRTRRLVQARLGPVSRSAASLLPDRSAETWAAWLRREPQIQLVARDRSTEYARGTTLGAPEAVQVADRWDLLLNIRQMIERWLARVHPGLKLLSPVGTPFPSTRRIEAYPRAPAEALARAAAVGRWEGLYDDVRRRRAAGQSLRQINRETGLTRATVRKYAFAERFPRHGRRGPVRSVLNPHLDNLHARHSEGCENAMRLWRELRRLGFPGTAKQVRRWLSERRSRPAKTTIWRLQAPSVVAPTAPTSSPPRLSPKRLLWHLLREPEGLDTNAAAAVARVMQDDEVAQVVDLARRFCRIVHKGCGGAQTEPSIIPAFDAWLADARVCGVRVVESFAVSLDQDGATVRAGLRLLKRSMHGQAKLDLLRRRFFLAA